MTWWKLGLGALTVVSACSPLADAQDSGVAPAPIPVDQPYQPYQPYQPHPSYGGGPPGQYSGNTAGDVLPPPPPGTRWQLTWHDEFNGQVLDPANWSSPPDGPRDDGYWAASNAHLDGRGHLVLAATPGPNGHLIGAEIDTRHGFQDRFGYWVARIKLPTVPGHRPAFWLQSAQVNHIDDPAHPTEIDILEAPGRDGVPHVNLHWNGYGAATKTIGSAGPPVDPGSWHTYGVLWTSTSYTFFVDGRPIWNTQASVSQVPEFIIFSDEAMAARGGDPERHAHAMGIYQLGGADASLVDYVRVYNWR